jgi:hypothetical protein
MLYYREKLAPAAWLVVAIGLVIPATSLIFLPINLLLGVAVGVGLWAGATGLLWWLSPTLTVDSSHFRAGDANLELHYIEAVSPFRGEEARAQRGVSLDARAWLVIRGWIDPVVKIELNDPLDPAPYWLVSTKHPEALIEALRPAGATT